MKYIFISLSIALLTTSGAFAQNEKPDSLKGLTPQVEVDPWLEVKPHKATPITKDPRFPESFPKFIFTGNYEDDEKKYQRSIQLWYQDHPAEGKELLDKGLIKL